VQALVVDVARVIAPVAAGTLVAAVGYRPMLVVVMVCSAFGVLALLVADRHRADG
jgi:hypothetical protein